MTDSDRPASDRPAHPDILNNPEGQAAMARIIDAVGPKIGANCKNIDLLRDDLNMAVTKDYEVPLDLGVAGNAAGKRALVKYRNALSAINKIGLAYADPKAREMLFAHYWSSPAVDALWPLIDELLKIQRKIDEKNKKDKASGKAEPEQEPEKQELFDYSGRSPFEYFVGVLVVLFEKHFGSKATFKRDQYEGEGKADGEFIRFASQVLTEFNIQAADGRAYAAETIAKALRKSATQ